MTRGSNEPELWDHEVVILAGVDYNYYRQRPQQLAAEWCALGCRTVYVEVSRRRLQLQRRPATTAELDSAMGQAIVAATRWEGDLAVTQAVMELEIVGQEPTPCLDVWLRNLRRLLDLRRPIFLVGDTLWGLALSLLREHGVVIYDCVDELTAFRGAIPPRIEGERRLLTDADLVYVTSPPLASSRGRLHPRVYLIPNGVRPELFQRPQRPERRWPRPVIGYVGALAYWVDTELIAAVARAHPNWTFVLTGAGPEDAGTEPLKGLPNVVLLGRVEYDQVPALLAQFDVGIVPFRCEEFTHNANPIKVYEYLAAGLPVVSTPIAGLSPFGDLVLVADGPVAFGEAIARALVDNDPQTVQRRLDFARTNSWQLRALTGLAIAAVYDAARRGEQDRALAIYRESLKRMGSNPELCRELWAALATVGLAEAVARDLDGQRDRLESLARELEQRGSIPAALALVQLLVANEAVVDAALRRWYAALLLASGSARAALGHFLTLLKDHGDRTVIPYIASALAHLDMAEAAVRWARLSVECGGNQHAEVPDVGSLMAELEPILLG